MAAPRFSILLPTHNRAEVLGYAIRSVLAQGEQDFELLIVGDGCTDGTAGVVASFADERIRWFDLPKAAHFGYANRNIALREARGDYIAYMAHDDLWFPDHLARLGTLLALPGIAWAYSRTLWVAPDGVITPAAFNLHDSETYDAFVAMEANNISATNVAHRRDCLERYGYWDEALPRNGDWELWSRIVGGGWGRTFAYEPEPTGLHFRAIWKTETTLGPPELYQWRDLRARGIYPATLPSVPTTPGELEQASAWRALRADPAREMRRIRREVQLVLDRVARRTDVHLTVLHQQGMIAQLQAEIAARDAQLREAGDHIAGLERSIHDKDRHIGNIEAQLHQRDARIAQLDAAQLAQARQIAEGEEARRQLLDAIATERARRDADMAHSRQLAQQLADKERHIARIEGRWPLRAYRRLRRLLR